MDSQMEPIQNSRLNAIGAMGYDGLDADFEDIENEVFQSKSQKEMRQEALIRTVQQFPASVASSNRAYSWSEMLLVDWLESSLKRLYDAHALFKDEGGNVVLKHSEGCRPLFNFRVRNILGDWFTPLKGERADVFAATDENEMAAYLNTMVGYLAGLESAGLAADDVQYLTGWINDCSTKVSQLYIEIKEKFQLEKTLCLRFVEEQMQMAMMMKNGSGVGAASGASKSSSGAQWGMLLPAGCSGALSLEELISVSQAAGSSNGEPFDYGLVQEMEEQMAAMRQIENENKRRKAATYGAPKLVTPNSAALSLEDLINGVSLSSNNRVSFVPDVKQDNRDALSLENLLNNVEKKKEDEAFRYASDTYLQSAIQGTSMRDRILNNALQVKGYVNRLKDQERQQENHLRNYEAQESIGRLELNGSEPMLQISEPHSAPIPAAFAAQLRTAQEQQISVAHRPTEPIDIPIRNVGAPTPHTSIEDELRILTSETGPDTITVSATVIQSPSQNRINEPAKPRAPGRTTLSSKKQTTSSAQHQIPSSALPAQHHFNRENHAEESFRGTGVDVPASSKLVSEIFGGDREPGASVQQHHRGAHVGDASSNTTAHSQEIMDGDVKEATRGPIFEEPRTIESMAEVPAVTNTAPASAPAPAPAASTPSKPPAVKPQPRASITASVSKAPGSKKPAAAIPPKKQ